MNLQASYKYFVEGLRPVSNAGGNVRYEVKDGVFQRVVPAGAAERRQKTEVRSQETQD
jgi:hypothetical protein